MTQVLVPQLGTMEALTPSVRRETNQIWRDGFSSYLAPSENTHWYRALNLNRYIWLLQPVLNKLGHTGINVQRTLAPNWPRPQPPSGTAVLSGVEVCGLGLWPLGRVRHALLAGSWSCNDSWPKNPLQEPLTTLRTAALALLTLLGHSCQSCWCQFGGDPFIYFFGWCQFLCRPTKRGPAETCYLFTYAGSHILGPNNSS